MVDGVTYVEIREIVVQLKYASDQYRDQWMLSGCPVSALSLLHSHTFLCRVSKLQHRKLAEVSCNEDEHHGVVHNHNSTVAGTLCYVSVMSKHSSERVTLESFMHLQLCLHYICWYTLYSLSLTVGVCWVSEYQDITISAMSMTCHCGDSWNGITAK